VRLEDYHHYSIEQLDSDICQSIETNEIVDGSNNTELIRSNIAITLVIESSYECQHGKLRKKMGSL
jgi:hypothetical protein